MLEEIRMVRLLSGEEIYAVIGTAKDKDGNKLPIEEKISLHKPHVLETIPDPEAPHDPRKAKMAFVPWLPQCIDQVYPIERKHIIVTGIPSSEFAEHYKNVTSPIVTPNKKIIA